MERASASGGGTAAGDDAAAVSAQASSDVAVGIPTFKRDETTDPAVALTTLVRTTTDDGSGKTRSGAEEEDSATSGVRRVVGQGASSAAAATSKNVTNSSCNEASTRASDDQNNDDIKNKYNLQVKKEYVLTCRDPSLPPLPKDEEGMDDRDRNKLKQQKKKKTSIKKRIRPGGNDSGTIKICSSVVRGEECRFTDKCRYSHDVSEYMKTRQSDIDVPEGSCPHYDQYGRCPYGVTCRFGSIHIDKSGNNVSKDVVTDPPVVMNGIRKDVQEQLRKKTYPFKCQRHKDVKQKERNNNACVDTTKKIDPMDPSTVPARKADEELLDNTKKTTTAPPSWLLKTTTSSNSQYNPLPSKERKIIDFSNKVYVAPLTTVGNLPFRRIMKKFGADITCGEMALCSGILEGKASEWALLKRHPSEDVFGIQLAAGYPDLFTRTCELIDAECTVDFVDFNVGCPIDLICKRGAGSALMLREKRLRDALLGAVTTLTSCPVTVKMRTGWDDNKPSAHTLVPKIISSEWGIPRDGIAAVMVHGRSRLQRYSNLANWDYIQRVAKSATSTSNGGASRQGASSSTLPDKDGERDPAAASSSLPSIPVIGNGDIFSYVDYEQNVLARPELSSCAMLARGALIKPWLPTEIKERRHWDISASERLDILRDFVRYGLEHWGSDQQGVNNCRRFLLEWMSFLHRYVPVGMLEVLPQQMNQRPPVFMRGRNDLETLFLSNQSSDWIKVSEMLLGPVPEGFYFEPKHKAKSFQAEG